jgi:hypothetical protein
MNISEEIIYGTLDSARHAIDAGGEINAIDEYGFTPLIQTAIENKPELTELLLQAGADVNLPDLVNRTALHWAADNNNYDLCKLLLEHGANPNAYTIGSQPVLTFALLYKHERVKQLLYARGADFNFAHDYINTKILGHLYELRGVADIFCAPEKRFLEVEFEGFFIETTVGLLLNALEHYRNHYAARTYRDYLPLIKQAAAAMQIASELSKYKHYLTDYGQHDTTINQLLEAPLLVLPVGYEGHAITFVRMGRYLAHCDRGEHSKRAGSTNIYYMRKPHLFNRNFIKQLIYKKQSRQFINEGIIETLGLELLHKLPIESQLTGNCSWANVEAAFPTMMFLLLRQANPQEKPAALQKLAMDIFHHWREWNKDIALNECIQSFYQASPTRKTTKAAILAAILFQRCRYNNKKDIKRAEKILPVLTTPEYTYVLKSYIHAYWQHNKTAEGENLMKLLDLCGVNLLETDFDFPEEI